ncbi:TolC family protein [bacterium]|nr:MAG: TolC family protein [bacterium]
MQDININNIKLDIAKKTFYFPSLSAFGNYNWSGDKISSVDNNKVFSFGLNLSYSLFQGYQLDVNRQIAEVNLRQKSTDLRQLEQQILSDLKKSVIDLQTAYKQLEILDRNIKSAEQDKLLSEENYRIGYGTLLDVQTSAINLNNLLVRRVTTYYDFYLAMKQIDYLSGKLNY